MKTITLIATLLIGLVTTAQSQYEKGMEKAFDHYEKGELEEAANLFERIGKAEVDNWLPYYYVARININKSWDEKDEAVLSKQLGKAQEFVNLAKTYSKDNPEIMILQAHILTAWIVFDGQRFGMTNSPKVSEIYRKAQEIAPDNPRVVLSNAEWNMGTAKYFGQDTTPYCKDVEKSIELFNTFEAAEKFYPTGGLERAQQVLESCKS